jgi:hypothetical protein
MTKNHGSSFANALSILVALGSALLACGICSILFFPDQILPPTLRPAPIEVLVLPTALPGSIRTPGGVVLPPLPTVPNIATIGALPTQPLPAAQATNTPLLAVPASDTPTLLLETALPLDPTATLTDVGANTPTLEQTMVTISTAAPPANSPTPTTTLAPEAPTATFTFSFSPFSFQLAPEGIQYTSHPSGCSFFGIAGHVYDLARTPIIGNLIRVTGPNNYQEDAIPGSQPIYGAGGFELVLSDQPTTTTNQYNVQLLNAAAEPLSDVIQLQTFAECEKNLMLLDFVQVR